MLTNVVKVVAGDSTETLHKVARPYERVVAPGVHRCSSIKAAAWRLRMNRVASRL